MKSDREFIDGIYEKAKQYTTEENSTSLTTYRRNTVRPYVWRTLSCAAALLLLCVAIDGISGKNILLQRDKQAEPTHAVQEMSVAFARFMPEQTMQTISVMGEISDIPSEEGYFLMQVEEIANDGFDSFFSQLGTELPVILVCYDTSVYKAESFVLGEKVSFEVCEGDMYGNLSENVMEAYYPVYTLQ